MLESRNHTKKVGQIQYSGTEKLPPCWKTLKRPNKEEIGNLGVRVQDPIAAIPRDHGGHPMDLVLLESEVFRRVLGQLEAARAGTHDDLICLPDDRQFRSFVCFLHLIHHLSVLGFWSYKLVCLRPPNALAPQACRPRGCAATIRAE